MTDEKSGKDQAITRDMTLGDLVTKHPQAAMVLAQKGLHCIGCGMAGGETIEQGCRAHGLDDEQIEEIIEELNKAVAEEKGK